MLYSLIIYAFFKLYLILNIYQQSHYDIKCYLKHMLMNFYFYDLFVLCSYLVYVFYNDFIVYVLVNIYIGIYSLFFLFKKKCLVFTKRIFRILILSVMMIVLGFILNDLFLIFLEFYLVIVFIFDKFISYLLNLGYIKKAKSSLDEFHNNIIGITGSFGKTSVKCLLNQALNCYEKSIASPKSYNTVLGISKFINSNVIYGYDDVILEYGISHLKDMDKLINLVKPRVCFITEIGYMHIDGLRNINNIINEKMKLALVSDLVVLNYENEFIRNYKLDKPIISYGFNYGRFRGLNLCLGEVSSFDFYDLDKYVTSFNVRLVGKHQILNFIGVVAYCYYLGLDLEVLKRGCLFFRLEKNRLEFKIVNGKRILDDSFNSNYKGFIEALNVLNDCKGKRILITPGMVELGRYNKQLLDDLGLFIVRSCDVVILVGVYQTRYLYQILRDYPIEIYIVKSFLEGYRLYMNFNKIYDDTTLLIENDLPDVYRVGY